MGKALTDKGRNTRRRIIDVAVELFRKEGFDNVSTATICKAANVSNGSFFHYFKEKEDILYAFVEDESDELLGMTDELDALDAQSALDRIVDWQCDYYEQKGCDFLSHFHSHVIASRRSESFQYSFAPVAAKIIQRGQEEGVFRANIDPVFAASLLFSRMTGMISYSAWPDASSGSSMKQMITSEYKRFVDQILL